MSKQPLSRRRKFREGLNRLVVHGIPYVFCRIGTHMFDVFRIYSYQKWLRFQRNGLRKSTDLRESIWLGTAKIDLRENLFYFGKFSLKSNLSKVPHTATADRSHTQLQTHHALRSSQLLQSCPRSHTMILSSTLVQGIRCLRRGHCAPTNRMSSV